MAYQVLARKWRPRLFQEVVGQDHVTRSLQNAVKSGKLAHAYLFTGTRGVGKTTIARLFAKAIRCENRAQDMNPCLQCQSCLEVDRGNSLDYIEIDGASNNSVDNIRELIENVQYLPSRGERKIYVIDEVHMLTVNAFNALLKTLEEPPAHVIFIFATTDPQKLLGTVLSRCQRFDFRHVSLDVLMEQVKKIALKEGIIFEKDVLVKKLCEYGNGSVRDTLSLFDQILGLGDGKRIDEKSFYQALGLARSSAVRDLLSALCTEDALLASRHYQTMLQENIDPKRIVDQLLESLYVIIQGIDQTQSLYAQDLLNVNALEGLSYAEIFWMYETFTKDTQWAMLGRHPEQTIDVILQKLARRRQILRPASAKVIHAASESKVAAAPLAPAKSAPVGGPKLGKNFEGFLHHLEQEAPAIKANLEQGNLLSAVFYDGQSVRVQFGFAPHVEVAKEFLEDADVRPKLLAQTAAYWEVETNKVDWKFNKLSGEETTERKFESFHDKEVAILKQKTEEKKTRLLENPYVQEAEKIFNSKIDKIHLNDEEIR